MTRAQRTILHFIDTIGPGGAETVCLQVADGLRSRGWSPHMISTGPGWVRESMVMRRLPMTAIETRRRLDLAYAMKLRRVVAEHRISLIHAHLFSPAVYASLVGALTDVPVVATFHGDSDAESGGILRRMRYRLIDRRASVVCVSDALRHRFDSKELIPASRIRVIHNGVDAVEFGTADRDSARSKNGVPTDAILVGAVGNVREAKDYPNFLRAAHVLASNPHVRFAVAGERTEPLHGDLLRLRARLGLEDRFEFLGFRDDIADVIAAFDVMVVSSKTEGFSIAAIQAMAAGIPVVATRSGGPEAIITDGVDGLLVPPGDRAALAAAVDRLIADASLRDRLTAAARITVQRRFSIENMLDNYEAIYMELTRS